MREFPDALPIDDALPRLLDALRAGTRAVLVAPPGAGKTTRVPLALLDEAFAKAGKIIVLEPRRLAARAAAARMASTLGEPVGELSGVPGPAALVRVRRADQRDPHGSRPSAGPGPRREAGRLSGGFRRVITK